MEWDVINSAMTVRRMDILGDWERRTSLIQVRENFLARREKRYLLICITIVFEHG